MMLQAGLSKLPLGRSQNVAFHLFNITKSDKKAVLWFHWVFTLKMTCFYFRNFQVFRFKKNFSADEFSSETPPSMLLSLRLTKGFDKEEMTSR